MTEPENEQDLLVTSGGRVLTESDIYELAREAEEGYDLDKLRPRRQGEVDELTGPRVGEVVCTCRMEHEEIASVDDDGDTVVTVSGWRCSYSHCCDPPDHTWSHEAVRRG